MQQSTTQETPSVKNQRYETMKQTILEEEAFNVEESTEVQFNATQAMDDQMENENFT